MFALAAIGCVLLYVFTAGAVFAVLTRNKKDGDEELVAMFWPLFLVLIVAAAVLFVPFHAPAWIIAGVRRRLEDRKLPRAEVRR